MKQYKVIVVALLVSLASCTQQKIETDLKIYEVGDKTKTITVKNNDGTIVSEIAFNKLGQLLYERNPSQVLEYYYGDSKFLQSLKMTNKKGEPEAIRNYVYDSDSKLIKIKEFGPHKSFRREVSYDYDENDNRVRGDLLTPYKDTLYTWLYGFNSDNKLISEQNIMLKPSKQSNLTSYIYNEKGDIMMVQEFQSDSVLMRERMFNLYHGMPLVVLTYNYWLGQVIDSVEYSYDFDKKGNWIKKDSKPSKGKSYQQNRRITYYE